MKKNNLVNINVRIQKQDKEKALKIFDNIGLDFETAFNIFIKKCIMVKGIPFVLVDDDWDYDYYDEDDIILSDDDLPF